MQAIRLVGLGILAVVIYAGVIGSYQLLVSFVVIPLLASIFIMYGFVLSRRRSGSDGLLWKGLVSFDEDDFSDHSFFPQIARTPKRSLGRQGLSGGHLQVRLDGVYWRAGSLGTPGAELSGSFFIPWTSVARVDISDVPMKLRFLGGALTIFLRGEGNELYGEFLGSRRALLDGLMRSPLAR